MMKTRLLIAGLLGMAGGAALWLPVSPLAAAPVPVIGQNPPTIVDRATEPQIELLNPGAEPRQAIRFKPAVNARQVATLTLAMDMAMTVAGNPVPQVKVPTSVMTMETIVTRIDPNGDIHYQFRYTNVDVIADPAVPKPVLDAVKAQNLKLIGIRGSFVMDDRGRSKSGSFTFPNDIDATTRQTLEQLAQSSSQFSAPMPDAAVGKGASWRLSSPITVNGIQMIQTAIYRLATLQDGVANLDVGLEQEAKPQKMSQPGVPPEVVMTLKSLKSQGQGKVMLRLDQLLPVRSTVAVRSTNEIATTRSGAPGETTFNTQTSIEMLFQTKE